MRNTFFLLLFLISGACFSQNPDPFWDGIRTKLVQPDTLSTFDRDAITPKLGTILYHKDTGISQWEQWDGAEWKTFGEGIPRDSLIVQSPSSFGNIYNYWEGTEAQMDALLLSDPNFFDDILWICTDCPQQGGGGTANQFVMGDGSFKNFIDDDTFASATSTNIPSSESVKAYVDANVFEVETGTFTPTVFDEGGGAIYTPATAEGYYTKIGDLCTISVRFTSISTSGTPTGVLKVGNFPFSSTEVSGHVLETASAQVSGSGVNYVSCMFSKDDGNGSTFTYKSSATSSNWSVPSGLIEFTSGQIIFTLTYVTE